jgi:hypothetical protein
MGRVTGDFNVGRVIGDFMGRVTGDFNVGRVIGDFLGIMGGVLEDVAGDSLGGITGDFLEDVAGDFLGVASLAEGVASFTSRMQLSIQTDLSTLSGTVLPPLPSS